mmetsp:Transcript_90761/g.292973  ORF Transcript_90761/g.292973 Transcript_90761/m.292973 type:complete len:206 (+) Transcript_90761:585-1202(+)
MTAAFSKKDFECSPVRETTCCARCVSGLAAKATRPKLKSSSHLSSISVSASSTTTRPKSTSAQAASCAKTGAKPRSLNQLDRFAVARAGRQAGRASSGRRRRTKRPSARSSCSTMGSKGPTANTTNSRPAKEPVARTECANVRMTSAYSSCDCWSRGLRPPHRNTTQASEVGSSCPRHPAVDDDADSPRPAAPTSAWGTPERSPT